MSVDQKWVLLSLALAGAKIRLILLAFKLSFLWLTCVDVLTVYLVGVVGLLADGAQCIKALSVSLSK